MSGVCIVLTVATKGAPGQGGATSCSTAQTGCTALVLVYHDKGKRGSDSARGSGNNAGQQRGFPIPREATCAIDVICICP